MKRGGPLRRHTPLKAKTGLKRGTVRLKRTSWNTKPKTRTKLPSIKSVKRKAWEAASRYVRARDPHCVTCLMDGRNTPSSEAGHYKHTSDKINQTLGGNMVWWDQRNLNGQCGRCNRHNSGELDLYGLYLEQKYGHGICQELDQLFRKEKKWTRDEALAVAAQYTTLLAELNTPQI